MYVRRIEIDRHSVGRLRWRIAQFAESRWWRRYLAGRDVRAYREWKETYWRTLVAAVGLRRTLEADRQYDLRILDAGCGPAGVFLVYPRASVTAVDPLLNYYEALPHFSRVHHPNVLWVPCALEEYRPETVFDLVYCLNVLNHVRDLETVLRVLAKALSPAGTLVLSVDAHRREWLKPLFRSVPGDVLHPHQLALGEYLSACTHAGLRCTSRLLYKRELIFDYWVLTLKHDLTSR